MIIAYSLFYLSCFALFLFVCIFMLYIFTDKLNNKKTQVLKLAGLPSAFWFIVSICSAQYIWG